ncbi:hypothetical protein L345_08823, partial [Ophiophagus hannah]
MDTLKSSSFCCFFTSNLFLFLELEIFCKNLYVKSSPKVTCNNNNGALQIDSKNFSLSTVRNWRGVGYPRNNTLKGIILLTKFLRSVLAALIGVANALLRLEVGMSKFEVRAQRLVLNYKMKKASYSIGYKARYWSREQSYCLTSPTSQLIATKKVYEQYFPSNQKRREMKKEKIVLQKLEEDTK